MSFHAYRTKPFEHTHENRAFNDLYVLLEQRYAKETEPVYLLGNVYANNTEIDAVVERYTFLKTVFGKLTMCRLKGEHR